MIYIILSKVKPKNNDMKGKKIKRKKIYEKGREKSKRGGVKGIYKVVCQ